MATVSTIEKFLLTISSGITGLELYRDCGIMTPELEYFVQFCREEHDLSVRAIAPSSMVEKYTEAIRELYEKVRSKMPIFDPEKSTTEEATETLEDLENLHDLLSRLYDISRVSVMPF